MTRCFRLEGADVGDVVHTVEALATFARDHGPGRHDVDEIRDDGFAARVRLDLAPADRLVRKTRAWNWLRRAAEPGPSCA
jgi:hypothetical protein